MMLGKTRRQRPTHAMTDVALTALALTALAALASGCAAKAETVGASEGAQRAADDVDKKHANDKGGGSTAKLRSALPVETAPVRTGLYVRSLTLPGHFAPRRIVRVAAEIPGRALEVNAEAGTDVSADDVLLRLDERSAKAAIAQIDAQIDAAKTASEGASIALKRTETLADSGVVDLATLDGARIAHKQAKAGVAVATSARVSADVHLTRHVVRAPITGRVVTRRIEAGEMINPGVPIYEIADLRTMILIVDAPEAQIASIHEGAAVVVRVPTLDEREVAGKVLRVPAVADTATRTFAVEIEVDNSDGALRGGMMARAELELGHMDDAVLVPIEAVVDEAGASGEDVVSVVYLAVGDAAVRRVVQTAEMSGLQIRIAKGLVGGEAMIVVGQRRVVDGDAIRVVTPQLKGLPPAPGGAAEPAPTVAPTR